MFKKKGILEKEKQMKGLPWSWEKISLDHKNQKGVKDAENVALF